MNTIIENNKRTGFVSDLVPYHGVREVAKLDELSADMKARGWVGVPLVRFGERLLTGSHRYAAARRIGLEEISVVNLLDVFDLDEGEVTELVESLDHWEVEITRLAIAADRDLAEELGMDIH